jgi:thiol-disulfide isomerase/thioredoxin
MQCLLGMCVLAAAGCSGTSDEPRKEPRNSLKPYELDNIPAPETAGKDSEGRALGLSDFKGKVVLVDFWATWCPPCRELIPHEKELVGAYKDKPFVLLGVSGDDSDEKLRVFEKEEEINWRSIRDGRWGPIHKEWGVEAVPTLFLVDHKGVIRYRFQGRDAFEEQDLSAAIEGLLKEATARQ